MADRGQAFFNRDHFPAENNPDGRAETPTSSEPRVLDGASQHSAQWHKLPQNYPNDKTVHPRFQIPWYATRFCAESS
jgi:hypothetical protein